ncbi:nucleoside phosphorylase [Rhizobium lusitanum]|uniref:nucleoside phosphorylase n=1 Tax=Rhizobium lusitanum TaxID=293958 RepID=UPI00195BBDA6|nr:nucleoside phosphorylase [Rhizobium lusitanum]MBM7049238.1 nucleoside phosphorylase [Rhizobium lusitanum]
MGYPYETTMPQFARDGIPTLTGFQRADVAPYVVLAVRDPLTVSADGRDGDIASFLEDARTVALTGLFSTVTGTYEGVPISVVSGGSGAPEAELALMDLFNYTDASAVLRIGGCGAWSDKVKVGDLVISAGAVRDEGMSKTHVRAEYPAAADHELVGFLADAARDITAPHHIGITRSGDSEYTGWGRPGPGGYLQDEHAGIIDYWRRAGILNTDRETSAILTLARLYGHRGGSVCSVGDNVVTGEAHRSGAGHQEAIRVGLSGLARLARADAARGEKP